MATATRRRTSPEERAAQVEALAEQLNEAVSRITTDETWLSMLQVAAQLHTYSIRNVLLLWSQAAERGMSITQVAGFQKWVSLGRHVRRGERGLKILAPCMYRLSEEEAARRGPAGVDAQGRPKAAVRGFKIEHVFDLSQTEGAPLPELPSPVTLAGAGPAGLWTAIADRVAALGYEIRREQPRTPGAFGSVSWTDRVVRVRPDIDEAQSCKTLLHELGHIEADHEHRTISRQQRETEAESVAYIVGQLVGLESITYSAPYVAGWSGGDHEVIQDAAEAVHNAARTILSRPGVHEHRCRLIVPTALPSAACAAGPVPRRTAVVPVQQEPEGRTARTRSSAPDEV